MVNKQRGLHTNEEAERQKNIRSSHLEEGSCLPKPSRLFFVSKGRPFPQNGKTLYWYRKVAEHKYANAQNSLGFCLQNGFGVAEDKEQAVYWFRKAAEQEFAAAQNNLGYCLENGIGVKKHRPQAVSWFRKAAEQEHAPAQFNLGDCYERGVGVQKDPAQAFYWYRKAAEQGDEYATEAVARLSTNRRGGQRW